MAAPHCPVWSQRGRRSSPTILSSLRLALNVIRRTAIFLDAIGGIADKGEHRPRLARLRTTMGLIETASGLLPYPWGDRVEVALRGIGGSFWFQITLAIILVRVVAWFTAVCWRRRPSKQRLKTDGDGGLNHYP